MSAPFRDGGPAFPIADMQAAHRVGMAATNGTGKPEADYIAASARATAGMTLRDYFAAKAMESMPPPSDYVGEKETADSYRYWSAKCYHMADAMLAARELKP